MSDQSPSMAEIVENLRKFAAFIKENVSEDEPGGELWVNAARGFEGLANAAEQNAKTIRCSHCEALFDLGDDGSLRTIAEHTRVCEKNPMVAEIAELKAAIRVHRDMAWDDRCLDDDRALYAVLDEPIPDFALPPEGDMIESCRRYIAQRGCPVKELPPGKMTIRQLESEVERLGAKLADVGQGGTS